MIDPDGGRSVGKNYYERFVNLRRPMTPRQTGKLSFLSGTWRWESLNALTTRKLGSLATLRRRLWNEDTTVWALFGPSAKVASDSLPMIDAVR